MDERIQPLNPPPEPALTFEDWFVRFHLLMQDVSRLAIQSGIAESESREMELRRSLRAAEDALCAHARKRIGS